MATKAKRITLRGAVASPTPKNSVPMPVSTGPSGKRAMDKQEQEWRAKEDAQTLARSASIFADKGRLAQAQKAARDIVKEKTTEVQNLKSILKGGR